ncbi:hypothetical protein NIES2098_48610 [Calothrix sp. NIES-2098]|nr:hypothetical protein NIES2098_48610 [Calothrix sp. NIES-2098]
MHCCGNQDGALNYPSLVEDSAYSLLNRRSKRLRNRLYKY